MAGRRMVIVARGMGPLGQAPVLGVPLGLWLVNTARSAGVACSILTDDERLALAAERHGVAPAAPGDETRLLTADARRPFCAPATLDRVISAGIRTLAEAQTTPIERLAAEGAEALELVRAVAGGLPPDHPCRAGITRLRLPLGRRIRAIISDVDGVLTDGVITRCSEGTISRNFFAHDGLAHHLLAKARSGPVRVGWLSATSEYRSIEGRAEMLRPNAPVLDLGPGDKGPRFTALCERLGVSGDETLYIGDDVNDLPAIERAGVSACPADAHPAVRARVDLVLDTPGGRGARRGGAGAGGGAAAARGGGGGGAGGGGGGGGGGWGAGGLVVETMVVGAGRLSGPGPDRGGLVPPMPAHGLQHEIGKKTPFDSVEQEAYLNVMRTASLLGGAFEALFKSQGLSESTYNVLRILRGEGEKMPCLAVAERLIARVPDITRLIDRLEKQGLVARARCEEDRRVVHISITRKGLGVLAKLDGPVLALHRAQLGHLSRGELRSLSELLVRARAGAAGGLGAVGGAVGGGGEG
ncbi:MAG: MarR family transcriptional regulator [Phycisphaerales bacterium]|nr:MarR family transcriptional regulator [Phycisphaerales bacterium]